MVFQLGGRHEADMVSLGFLLGLIALLAVPGPTNILLATAGATRGWRAAPQLLLAELLSYLTAVAVLGFVLAPVVAGRPEVNSLLQCVAALLLFHTSWRLWRTRTELSHTPIVSWRQVTLTTLMNPKCLVIAFGLMPQDWTLDAASAFAHLSLFALVTPVIGGFWIIVGQCGAQRLGPVATRGVPKFSAIALSVFALVLVRSAFAV